MPSGKKIAWEAYDYFIVTYLPTMTIEELVKTHLPHISAKAVGSRARKLGIKPVIYKPTDAHKQKIATKLEKLNDGQITRLREIRDGYSVDQLAEIFSVDELTIHRAIKKHGIELSDTGKERAFQASRVATVGCEPWNKGMELSEETKAKISEATSGERNSQYGKGMTEEEKERWRVAYFSHGIHKTREWLKSDEGQRLLKSNGEKSKNPEARQANSLRSSKLMQAGILKPGWGKSTKLQTAKGGSFTVKSSYEVRYVEILEADPDVVSFVYEPLRIQYEFEGATLWYIPDFLVRYADREELVEVKPRNMLLWPKNVAKFEAGKRVSFDFKIITEEELFGSC